MKVKATVILEIDAGDKEEAHNKAGRYLRQCLVEKAPDEEIEENAVREKPYFMLVNNDVE